MYASRVKGVINSIIMQNKNKKAFYQRIKNLDSQKYFESTKKLDVNIIIIVVDCLRHSHLSYNGYIRKTSPFLDELKCPKFASISASPWTFPSVTSILTGLYPHNHRAVIGGEIKNFDELENFRKIDKNVLTLPELCYLSGHNVYFATTIDTAFYPFTGRVIPIVYRSKNAMKVVKDFTEWSKKINDTFFAYLHLGDLHEPLHPPKVFKTYFGEVENIPKIERWDYGKPDEQRGDDFKKYRENRILLYDNTVRYVDYVLEEFYGLLEDLGVIDSSLLVITADHGEEFWEHAEFEANNFFDPRGCYGIGHGHQLFNEIIKVPLLFTGGASKDIPERTAFGDNVVSAVDIYPTIMDVLGINYFPDIDGSSICDSLREKTGFLSEAVGYGYEKKALIRDNYKLYYSPGDNMKCVFDLYRDPVEQHPIFDEKIVDQLIEELKAIMRSSEKRRLKEVIGRKDFYKKS